MSRALSASFFMIAVLVTSAGCMLVEQTQEFTRQSFRVFRPRPSDWTDEDVSNGEWDKLGNETRQFYAKERDPDRWFKKYIMSERANQIEKNVGVD